jgi:hypothetical protein
MKPRKRLKGEMRGVRTVRESLSTLWGTGGELVDMKQGDIALNAEQRLKCVLCDDECFLTAWEADIRGMFHVFGVRSPEHFSYR